MQISIKTLAGETIILDADSSKIPSKSLYTVHGKIIKNPVAYAATGAPIYKSFKNPYGRIVRNPIAYTNAGGHIIPQKNINAYRSVYEVTCESGVKYIGETGNFNKRMKQHFSGKGSKVTQKFKPIKAVEKYKIPGYLAKRVENYHVAKVSAKRGGDKVRGGNNCNSKNIPVKPKKRRQTKRLR